MLNYHDNGHQEHFVSNYISTTHYTAWNFFPLSLFNQFKRLSNFYFLVIAILQSIPAISPLNPFTAIAPLVFVIGLSMARDAYEDYKRYKLDDETNKKVFKVLKHGQF
jgi:magnesium-transporting ATPase (P-type)